MLREKIGSFFAALYVTSALSAKLAKSQDTGLLFHGDLSVSFNSVDNYAQKKSIWRLIPRIGGGYLFANSFYVGAELYGVFRKSKHRSYAENEAARNSYHPEVIFKERLNTSKLSLGLTLRAGIKFNRTMPYVSLSWEKARWSRMSNNFNVT